MVYALADSTFHIQFDKPVYSPGQEVKGRIYAINSDTNAIKPNGKYDVVISDNNGDSVKKFVDIEFSKLGKFEFSYELPSDAMLGAYFINVYQESVEFAVS